MSSTVARGIAALERSVGPGEIQGAVRKEARHPHLASLAPADGRAELGGRLNSSLDHPGNTRHDHCMASGMSGSVTGKYSLPVSSLLR